MRITVTRETFLGDRSSAITASAQIGGEHTADCIYNTAHALAKALKNADTEHTAEAAPDAPGPRRSLQS